jgi:hypothetical protein
VEVENLCDTCQVNRAYPSCDGFLFVAACVFYKEKKMYVLEGKFKNEPYETISRDVEYLKGLQTKILRHDGSGLIKLYEKGQKDGIKN